MANQPITIDRFPGLRLDTDPSELGFNGALDLENIDYVQNGVPQLRPGTYYMLHRPQTVDTYGHLYFWNNPQGEDLIFGARDGSTGSIWNCFSVGTGLEVDSPGSTPDGNLELTAEGLRIAAYGDDTNETTFYATTGYNAAGVMERFSVDSLLWDTPTYSGEQPVGALVAVTPWDNRLVNGGGQNNSTASTLLFSDEGDPESFPSANTLTLHPGDGEEISEIITWGNRLFVFKNSKFYVFWGTNTTTTGTPIFEYDTYYGEGINPNGGRRAAVMRDGLYFANQHGLFRTTGGPPVKVSQAVQPLWEYNGSSPPWSPYLSLSNMNLGTGGTIQSLTASGDRLLMGTIGTRQLVYNPYEDWWSIWELPQLTNGYGMTGVAAMPGGEFAYGSTGNLAEILVIQAHSDDGVWGGSGTTYMDGQANEVQTLIASGGTAGNFTLTWNGQTTANIAYNDTAATVQTRLENLSNIAVGDVTCSGGPLPNSMVYIEFKGDNLRENVAAITVGTENVTNGNATLATLRAGTTGTAIPAYWISGGTTLGGDAETVIRDAVVTSYGGVVGLAVSSEFGAFPTAEEHTFTTQEALRYRSASVNVSGRTLAIRLSNDDDTEAETRFNVRRVTLNMRGRRSDPGLDAER